MSRRLSLMFCLALCAAWAGNAHAAFTFTTPDAPLNAAGQPGLNGQIWSKGAIAPVDTLAQARAYIGANASDSLFSSTVVDYPNGNAGSTSTGTTFNTALGADAGSLSNPPLGANTVLDSILRLTGFLRIETPNTVLSLGLGSDDGSELLIQGTQVIANDFLHPFPGAGDGPESVTFVSSGLYGMEILFFESQVVQWGLEFYLNSPAAGTPVPNRMLVKGTVPEPSSIAVWGLVCGLGMMANARWFRRRS